MLQDEKLLSGIATELLPILAASSATVLQGDLFNGAAKHADALKHLASVWEALAKSLSKEWHSCLGDKQRKLVQGACQATHQNAATAKVGPISFQCLAFNQLS